MHLRDTYTHLITLQEGLQIPRLQIYAPPIIYFTERKCGHMAGPEFNYSLTGETIQGTITNVYKDLSCSVGVF